jgi:hypothetical protein
MNFLSKYRAQLPWNVIARQQQALAQGQEVIRQYAGNLELMAEEMAEMRGNVGTHILSGSSPETAPFMAMRLAEAELLTYRRFDPAVYELPAHEAGIVLNERMAELELALEDRNWLRLAAETNREFSRQGLRAIMMLSRFFFLKNPLMRRGVTLQSQYVWGQGVNISAADDDINMVLQDFMDDVHNKSEMFSHEARVSKEQELQVTGNLFFVFFPDTNTGHVRLRTIPADEVQIIHCSPDDQKEPWYYERTWTPAGIDIASGASQAFPPKTILYPDYRYLPSKQEKQAAFGGKTVAWDSPVMHVRAGGLADMRFGTPEYYAALDWARAYSEFLQENSNRASFQAKYRKYYKHFKNNDLANI